MNIDLELYHVNHISTGIDYNYKFFYAVNQSDIILGMTVKVVIIKGKQTYHTLQFVIK